MANKLLFWLLGRVLDERSATRAAKRRSPGAGGSADPRAKPVGSARKRVEPALGTRLVGDPQPHNRVVLVPRDRIALVVEKGQPTAVARPKTYLWPPIVPTRRPMTVLVAYTGVVRLILTVRDLVTVDGQEISHVTAQVSVRLNDADGYNKLGRTAAEAGEELEAQLLDRVERELGNEIQVAVQMNRLDDLRRLSLNRVLDLRGLPTHLAGGVLDVEAIEVTEVGWPVEEPAAEPTGEPTWEPKAHATASPAGHPPERLDLTTDAQLRRLWLTHSDVELDGIAGAQVDGVSTVVAVPQRTPGFADLLAVKEAFRRQSDGQAVTVVATPAHSYPELVQGWFRQIDATPSRLVSVRPSGSDVLRVIVDQALRSGDGEVRVGSPADREALRRLLPYRRVEFVASDEAAALSERLR